MKTRVLAMWVASSMNSGALERCDGSSIAIIRETLFGTSLNFANRWVRGVMCFTRSASRDSHSSRKWGKVSVCSLQHGHCSVGLCEVLEVFNGYRWTRILA